MQTVHYTPHHWPRILLTVCSVLTLCSVVPLAWSDHADDKAFALHEDDLLTSIPVITSATRLAQKVNEAPASITVIDKATIASSGAQNLPDLLRLVPGFQVFHVSTNKFGATYHGFSNDFPNRLEVMIDGRSVYLPLFSAVDWTSLGLGVDDLERIEIIRGSNVATHGSNALLGAINFVTRSPLKETGAEGGITAGSLNTRNAYLRVTDDLLHGRYRISASHQQNDGSRLHSDDASRQYINLAASLTPTLRHTLDLRIGLDRGHTRTGSLKSSPLQRERIGKEVFIARRDYSANYQDLTWTQQLSPHQSVYFRTYRNYLSADEQPITAQELQRYTESLYHVPVELIQLQLNANPGYRALGEHGTTSLYDMELGFSHTQDEVLKLNAGAGYRHEKASSLMLLQSGTVSGNKGRAFSNAQLNLTPDLVFNLGALYERQYTHTTARSTRTSINYSPLNSTTFRLGYSHSQRLPSLLERFGNFTLYQPDGRVSDRVVQANTALRAETLRSYEFGLLHALENMNGYFDLRIYREEISDGIVSYWIPAGDDLPGARSRTNRNAGAWTNTGAELQLNLQPLSTVSATLNYGYNRTQTSNWDQGGPAVNRTPFNRAMLSPRHTVSALISWQVAPDMTLSAAHYFMDKVHWLEGDDRKAYNRTDLKAAKIWNRGLTRETELALVVQNAFGPDYQEFYDYHDFERRVFIQLMMKYH